MHQLTGCNVNITEIQLSSSHGVSCDPAQKDMFWSYQCQTVQSPFNPSLFLFVTLSPPGSLLPEKTKGQTNREQRKGCAVAGDTQTLSRYRRLFLSLSCSILYLAGTSLSSTDVVAECANKPPSLAPLAPSYLLLTGTATLAPRQARDRVMRREGGDRMKWRGGPWEVRWPLL